MTDRLLIATALLALSVTGCAATAPSPRPDTAACDHPERDLTRAWAERRYWCVPAGIGPAWHDTPASAWRGPVADADPTLHGPRP